MRSSDHAGSRSQVSLPFQILLVAGAVTVLARSAYYLLAPWITSINRAAPSGTLTPSMESWNAQRDGIELYALYIAMFLIVGAVSGIVLSGTLARRRGVILVGSAIAVAIAAVLPGFVTVTLAAPWVIPMELRLLTTLVVLAALIAYFRFGERLSRGIEWVAVVVVCGVVCFVGAEPTDISNSVYIFGPAMRLLQGLDIRDTYMQYELLNTLVATAWLKLGLGIEFFSVLVQATYFIAFLALFAVARRLFRLRTLAVAMVLALVLVRILGVPWEPWIYPQTGPLRVDMWIVPLLIILWRGPFSLPVPLICGVLVITHGPFGLVWMLAWIQLVLALVALSVLDNGMAGIRTAITRSWLLKWGLVGLYLASCVLLYGILFERNLEATSLYQSLGIGFLPMQMSSFFWVFPPVFAALATTVALMRSDLPPRYLASTLGLLLFTIAICVYFFGRSHEWALSSITIALIPTVFFLLDVADRWLEQATAGHPAESSSKKFAGMAVPGLAICLLTATTFSSLDRLAVTVGARVANLASLQLPVDHVPPRTEARYLLAEVAAQLPAGATFELMIMDRFMEYAVNEIFPATTGFFYPSRAFVFEEDLIAHAQQMIDSGRALLIDQDVALHLLPDLRYPTQPKELSIPGYVSMDHSTPGYLLITPEAPADAAQNLR